MFLVFGYSPAIKREATTVLPSENNAFLSLKATSIESRPSKKGLGRYLFFVDFNGHQNDEVIQDILNEIKENTYFLKVLGSYPEFKLNL